MSINYDPSKAPQMKSEHVELAISLGLAPIAVICDEPDAQPGDETGVSFIAYVSFVPRNGDRVVTQDKKSCVVRRVYHQVNTDPRTGFVMMTPNVYASRIDEDAEEQDES